MSDGELAYIVGHEAYYADDVRSVLPDPYLTVGAGFDHEDGSAWEFNLVKTRDTDESPVMRLEMNNDSFRAFQAIPEFFAALAERRPKTLTQVKAILDGMGARDITKRSRKIWKR